MERKLNVSTADAAHISIDLAGVGARSLAFIIDWKIRAMVAIAWFSISMYLAREFDLADLGALGDINFQSLQTWICIVPTMLIFLLYHPLIELITRGRTPGKRIVGIRVADLEGGTPGAGPILVRNLFRILDSAPTGYLVGLVAGLTTKHSVRIGDLAAGTVLVYEERVTGKSLSKVQTLVEGSGFEPEDQALLHEVIERWYMLEKKKRILFGGAVLDRAGIRLDIDGKRRSVQAQAIRRALLKLARNQRTAQNDTRQAA